MVQCVILAGGLATRLRPISESIPKALVSVGDRPFADLQLRWLSAQGVRDVLYCVGNLGEQIIDFVGTGQQWQLNVAYCDEGRNLRGTGGALRLALDRNLLQSRFLVLYGDTYLDISVPRVIETFNRSRLPALMTVLANSGQWDTSNADFRDGLVRYNKEDPTPNWSYIDYGLLAFQRSAIATIPPNRRFDLAQLLQVLGSLGQLAGFEATRRFYEIGSVAGLQELSLHLKTGEA